jgi:hypothetical protein
VENEKAEPVDKRVAEHVQRVGKEGGGTRQKAGPELDTEHYEIDHKHNGQDASLAETDRGKFFCLGFATLIRHALTPLGAI